MTTNLAFSLFLDFIRVSNVYDRHLNVPIEVVVEHKFNFQRCASLELQLALRLNVIFCDNLELVSREPFYGRLVFLESRESLDVKDDRIVHFHNSHLTF